MYKPYQSFMLRLTLPVLFLAATGMCEKTEVCVIRRGYMQQLETHLERANTAGD